MFLERLYGGREERERMIPRRHFADQVRLYIVSINGTARKFSLLKVRRSGYIA